MKLLILVTIFVLGILCLAGILAAGVPGGFLGINILAWYVFSVVTGLACFILALSTVGENIA